MPSITQPWTHDLPFMQQTVLLTAIRGPDGNAKYDPPKMLLRWFRRCVLISALDKEVLIDPADPRGGSFTGPSIEFRGVNNELVYDVKCAELYWKTKMEPHVDEYISRLDAIPAHFQRHFMHAIEILGYKHPDYSTRLFWHSVYCRLAKEMHLGPESEVEMDARLSDDRTQWLERSDSATRK